MTIFMSSSIVHKYALTLTIGDTKRLFDKLTDQIGSKTAAAKAIQVTRKTAHDWNRVKDVKTATRERLLLKLMEVQPVETLLFLLGREQSNASDLLTLLFENIQRTMLRIDDPKKARVYVQILESVLHDFSHLMAGKADTEFSFHSDLVSKRLRQLEIDWAPPPREVFTAEELGMIINILSVPPLGELRREPAEVAQELRIPTELFQQLTNPREQFVKNVPIGGAGIMKGGQYGFLGEINTSVTFREPTPIQELPAMPVTVEHPHPQGGASEWSPQLQIA